MVLREQRVGATARQDGRLGADPLGSDRLFFWVTCVLMVALAMLPVVGGWLQTPVGHEFTGFVAGRDDFYSYLSKMREGWEGSWLYVNRYTLEQQQPALIFGFYVALGHVCRWLHLPLWVGFHLSRAVLLPAALGATWAFIGTQVRTRTQRRLAFVLGFFLSGFFIFFDGRPGSPFRIEMRLGDHFYLAHFYPHYLVDTIGLLCVFVLFLRALQRSDWRHYLGGAACLWAIALVHPYMVLPALGVPGLYALVFHRDVLWRAWGYLTGIGLCVAPLMGYLAWVLYGDPVLSAWRQQARAVFPFPWLEVFWFGLGLPLAVVGAYLSCKRRDGSAADPGAPAGAMAMTWALVILLLVNIPLLKNRLEFALVLSLPLGVLVAHALEPLHVWLAPRRGAVRALVGAALPFVLCFSAIFVVVSSTLASISVQSPFLRNEWYRSEPFRAGMDWLATHSDTSTVVVAAYTAANQVPALTPARVYAGHLVETLGFWDHKWAYNSRFYTGAMKPEDARNFLRDTGASYVVEDRYSQVDLANVEDELKPLVPGLERYTRLLQPVFNNRDITIYRVVL